MNVWREIKVAEVFEKYPFVPYRQDGSSIVEIRDIFFWGGPEQPSPPIVWMP